MARQSIPSARFAHKGIPAQQGVVLLEALVAILIFSMGILALVGLQAAMVKNTSDSKYRSEASYIAERRIGMMWADPTNAAAYVEPSPGTDISDRLPNGRRIVTQLSPGMFVVTVTWLQPGTEQTSHSFTTTATITGG